MNASHIWMIGIGASIVAVIVPASNVTFAQLHECSASVVPRDDEDWSVVLTSKGGNLSTSEWKHEVLVKSGSAEGVETEQQLEQIRRLGFTEMQGYLFSQPLPGAKPFPLQWSLAPR